MYRNVTVSFLIALTTTTSAHAQGERVALCAGINRCDDTSLGHRDYAESDVTKLGNTLRGVGYKVTLMTAATAKTDPRLAPNKRNLDSQLEGLLAKRKPEDLVVLVFAGQAIRFEKDADCYLCPIDGGVSKDQKETLVSLSGVFGRLGRCGAGAKVVLADFSRDHKTGDSQAEVLEKELPQGVFALLGCSSNEKSFESQKLQSGIFFHGLSKQLENLSAEGTGVEFMGLAKDVVREVQKAATDLVGNGARQTPSLKSARSAKQVDFLTRADREILADWHAKSEWRERNGNTKGFYKENGPRRVAAWKAAAERGSTKGMLLYARCLEEAAGVAKDLSAAVLWCRRAAELGDAAAMYNLAYNYSNGVGVGKDVIEGFKLYRKAAEFGDIDALVSLGSCYYHGEGVKKDQAEAVKWYRKAAESGDANAMVSLGSCYYLGGGVNKDQPEGVKWYRKAAEKGHADAIYDLGVAYHDGLGVPMDVGEAVKCYRKAAELGHADAVFNLGTCYRDGEAVAKDLSEAVKCFRRAADLGCPAGMCELGRYFEFGVGVTKDAAEAVKWYRKAAYIGDYRGMQHLAVCYHQGIGVKTDLAEAVKWYRKAADLGDVESMYALGYCHQLGEGVERNDKEAVKWYRKAATLGSEKAKQALELLGEQ